MNDIVHNFRSVEWAYACCDLTTNIYDMSRHGMIDVKEWR